MLYLGYEGIASNAKRINIRGLCIFLLLPTRSTKESILLYIKIKDNFNSCHK